MWSIIRCSNLQRVVAVLLKVYLVSAVKEYFVFFSFFSTIDLGTCSTGHLDFNFEIGPLQVAYKAVMQSVTSADKAGYESLLMLYGETDVSQERTRILSKKIPYFVFLPYSPPISYFLYIFDDDAHATN